MASISGKLIGLQVNGQFISCELSCDFNLSAEMLPASAIDSAGWREYIAGIRTWSMSVSAQLLAEAVGADFKTVINAVYSRLPVAVRWGTRLSATTQLALSGLALPSTVQATAPNKGLANYNITFQGTGPLSNTFEDFSLIIDSMPASADYPLVINEDVT